MNTDKMTIQAKKEKNGTWTMYIRDLTFEETKIISGVFIKYLGDGSKPEIKVGT